MPQSDPDPARLPEGAANKVSRLGLPLDFQRPIVDINITKQGGQNEPLTKKDNQPYMGKERPTQPSCGHPTTGVIWVRRAGAQVRAQVFISTCARVQTFCWSLAA